MLLTEFSLGDAQVITISGRFDRNHEVALETALWQAEQKGCRQVIFNLEKLSSMDKVGIGNILFAYYGLKRKGILLSLVNPRPSVQKVLQFVELTPIALTAFLADVPVFLLIREQPFTAGLTEIELVDGNNPITGEKSGAQYDPHEVDITDNY